MLSDEDWIAQLNFLTGKTPTIYTGGKVGHPYKQLDEAGIIALHNEGWSNRRIARHMGQPSRTIDYRIIKLRKEGRIR